MRGTRKFRISYSITSWEGGSQSRTKILSHDGSCIGFSWFENLSNTDLLWRGIMVLKERRKKSPSMLLHGGGLGVLRLSKK